MATLRDVIKASLQSIGALADGETPNGNEEEEARQVFNRMLGSWSVDGFLVNATTREEFTLTASQPSRTLGSGGNFNTSVPVKILAATIEDQSASGTPEYPVEILTAKEWAAIGDKSLTAAIPTKIWLDGAYPLNVIYFWPIPSAANKLVLYSEKPLSSFTSVATTFQLPEGYEEACVMNLGRKLARNYGKVLDADYVADCERLLGNVKRKNMKPTYSRVDDALINTTRYDIFKG